MTSFFPSTTLTSMATLNPVFVRTKSGKQIFLRSPTAADANELLDYGRMAHSETGTMVTLPEEFSLTIADEQAWIERLEKSSSSIAIVAESDGKIIGMIDFHGRPNRKRVAHTGAFGMAVYPDHRGDGVGTLLIQALLDWTDAHPLIKKVGLAVFSTNDRAIRLYRKMGFVEEGRRMNEIQIEPDKFIDDILMYRWCEKSLR